MGLVLLDDRIFCRPLYDYWCRRYKPISDTERCSLLMAVVKVQQDAGKRRSSTYRKWLKAFPRLWYSVVAREPLWRRNVG